MAKSTREHRLQLVRLICVHSYALLVLLLLSRSDIVSGQLDNLNTSFVQSSFNNLTITCSGSSSLTYTLPGAMCLTPPNTNQTAIAGRCYYNNPIVFNNTNYYSFSTMFSFTTLIFSKIVGTKGQGFTFFIGPDKAVDSATGAYLGWLNAATNGKKGHNFAVEFDIYQNNASEGFNDTDDHHVGINVNSLNSTYSVPSPDILSNLTSYSSIQRFYAWIDYDGKEKRIEVSLSLQNRKPCKTLISYGLDLTDILNVTLDPMYVGFSSSSGGSDNYLSLNNINSQTTVWDWSFNAGGKATDLYKGNANCRKKVSWTFVLALVIALLTVAVCLLLGLILFLHRRTRKLSDDLEHEREELIAELKQLDYGAREFTYQALLEATNGFKEAVGKGGFGTVYKGRLSCLRSTGHETIVAVKKIKRTSDSVEDVKQLVAEVKVIGRLRHSNIVPLLGWCYDRGEMLLVYKYMENGDVDMHLFPSDYGFPELETFSWERRLRTVRGVAAALHFLHEGFDWSQSVVHRDVKTRNVMLDHNFNARLGDFGLARLYDRSNKANYSDVQMGTKGYIAPEYMEMGPSVQTDVYSFGVLALVVATGRNPLDRTIAHGQLVTWVRNMLDDGKIEQCRDAKLKNEEHHSHVEMDTVLKVGLWCCAYKPEDRPSMLKVSAALQGTYDSILSSPLPPQFPQQLPSFNLAMLSEDSDSVNMEGVLDYLATRSSSGNVDRSISQIQSGNFK